MRIAVFSDVHGNLPALQAVYKHILQQKTDAVYCLGDLVNQNVWNNETVEFIEQHHIPCVLGNHDEGIGNNKTKFPYSFGNEDEEKWGKQAIQYTLQQVTDDNKKILRQLPLKIQIQIKTGGNARKIVFAHGSPSNNKERLYRFYKQENFLRIMDEANADILFIGNTHASFHKIISTQKNNENIYRHIINPGSVGYPKDGSWHACYAVIDIDVTKDIAFDLEALQVNFFRLDYDINKTIRAIQRSPLPIHYAGRLLKY